MYREIGILLIVLSFGFLYSGTTLFNQGFHNVDLSHNFMKVSKELDLKIHDYNISFLPIDKIKDNSTNGIITLQEGYRGGIMQMREGFICVFLSGAFLAIGIYFVGFFTEDKKR